MYISERGGPGGEGRASTQGWRALLAISSSPLVPCGPVDRRGAGTRGVSGVRRTSTFLYSPYIYLSIYLYVYLSSLCHGLYIVHSLHMLHVYTTGVLI